MTEASDESIIAATAELYHDWITGLILSLVTRKGADVAERFVFALFRRQQHEKFLPGLDKLGLTGEPDAVASAKYHYFSNQLGGVGVEYHEESPRKAWVRYPPPRWIWAGTAICAVPGNVNRAMLAGWHANNGVSLGNPRLGFVCTKTTVDGQPGLEGYYLEHEHPLAPDERLRFAPGEECPPIDLAALPALDAESWPAARRSKAYRNYAMEYLRNGLPMLTALLGPEEARYIGRLSALQIGMQGYRDVAAASGTAGDDPDSFAALLTALLVAQGDRAERTGASVRQSGWRLRGQPRQHRAVFEAVMGLYEGLLSVHNRFLTLTVEREPEGANDEILWHVLSRRRR